MDTISHLHSSLFNTWLHYIIVWSAIKLLSYTHHKCLLTSQEYYCILSLGQSVIWLKEGSLVIPNPEGNVELLCSVDGQSKVLFKIGLSEGLDTKHTPPAAVNQVKRKVICTMVFLQETIITQKSRCRQFMTSYYSCAAFVV